MCGGNWAQAIIYLITIEHEVFVVSLVTIMNALKNVAGWKSLYDTQKQDIADQHQRGT